MGGISLDSKHALRILFIGLDSGLHPKQMALIDDQLTVLGDFDLKPIERPRCRSFEVQPASIKPASVARTLELVFGRKPPRSTPKMRAFGKDGVNAFLFVHDPDAVLLFVLLADLADGVIGKVPGFEGGRWLKENPGERRADKT
jgi:hypothetical protein